MPHIRFAGTSPGTLLALLLAACSSPAGEPGEEWLRLTGVDGVVLEYRAPDAGIAATMLQRVAQGREAAAGFLALEYASPAAVRLYPTAETFAAAWRSRTGAPPQCWMIANGGAGGVEMLSPRVWIADTCGHDGGDGSYVQGVVAHELVHVLHHQHNADPARLQREAEWWEEGLAVLASGQLDAARRARVRQQVADGFAPATLREAWEGSEDPYAVGGSLVHYIDSVYGRAVLRELVAETTLAGLLGRLEVTEPAFLQGWREFAAAY